MIRFSIPLAVLIMTACAAQDPPTVDETSAVSTPAPSQATKPIKMSETKSTIYNVEFTSITGKPLPFSDLEGTVTLVVNTASRCGYTGQYSGLQELYSTFEEQGFTILGIPSNDFGAQEPGTEDQIATFCEMNYGVEFPLTRKTEVVGPNQHDFYRLATKALGPKAEPKWNFHKILVGRDGQFLQTYPSSTRPADVELIADIERALKRP